MLMIRLQRVGRKNDPSFRVVVVDHRQAAKTGKVIEVVGSHDARVDRTELKAERVNYWLGLGAKASATVNNLLVKKGVSTAKTIDVSSKKLGKKASAAVAKAKASAVSEPVAEEIKEDIAVEEVKEELAPNEVEG